MQAIPPMMTDWKTIIRLTITASIKVNNAANLDIDNAEEALILLLELLLVKDLNREDGVLIRPPVLP